MDTGVNEAYLFEPGIAPNHFAGLQMVGGTTEYRTSSWDTGALQIGSIAGSAATMLCSNTTATVSLPFIMNGVLNVVNSTLTVTQPATIAGVIDLANNGHIVFTSGADVSGNITLDMNSVIPPSITGATFVNNPIIRLTGDVEEGKIIADLSGNTGAFTFDKSNLPKNWAVQYGVDGPGLVSTHYYCPTSVITIR